jgi:glycosyltransferase involved in cell wall biosynthesis
MSSTPAIVFFLSSEWSRYHRPGLLRAVARACAPDQAVLVVNNPVCLTTSRWQRPQRWAAWKAGGEKSRLTEVAPNLMLLDAAVALHDKLADAVPGAPWLNRLMLRKQVGRALNHLKRPNAAACPCISWFQFPTFHHYPDLLDESLAVYECYDEHADLPGLSQRASARLVALEQKLMRRCDLVFTTSKPLFDLRRAQHANVALTYNGADLDFFAAVAQTSLQTVTQRSAAAPTVGYLGTIHAHTDVAVLATMAQRRPSWRFVLIGPVQVDADEASLAALRAAPNVVMHGWVDDAQLVTLLSTIDVGVIPYRPEARFNRFVNPNKLHEYTAMGKPVVASPGLDLTSHLGSPSGAVSVASGVDEFIAAIEAEHTSNSSFKVQQRLHTAAANSWDARARLMLGHISRTLESKAQAVTLSLHTARNAP